jgi:hypothetical protein
VGLLGCSENDRSRLLPGRFTLFHDLLTFLGSSGREEGWFLVEREREEGEERRIMDEYSKKARLQFLSCSRAVFESQFSCVEPFLSPDLDVEVSRSPRRPDPGNSRARGRQILVPVPVECGTARPKVGSSGRAARSRHRFHSTI